jgi:hypothetical protein
MVFWMEILNKKGLEYLLKNHHIYEVIPIELFVKIVEITCKTMLES